ncbi:hypothetical protein OKW27_004074, partial [Paraburkholderia sp. 35.1]
NTLVRGGGRVGYCACHHAGGIRVAVLAMTRPILRISLALPGQT